MTTKTLKKEVKEIYDRVFSVVDDSQESLITIDGKPVSLEYGIQRLIEVSRGVET